MSDQPTAAPPKPGEGKKYLGLTRQQLLIVGGVFVVALGYLWWRNKQASAASSQTPTSAGSNECTDANGNPVDCSELEAQELAALQNQLDQLQANGSSSGSGGGYGSDGSGTVTGSTTPSNTTNPSPNTPTTSTGGTATTTATKAGAISNLQAYNVKTTTATIKWNPATNASQGYYYAVTTASGGQTIKSGNTKSTSVSLSGLKSKTAYNFGVQGLPGGPGDNIHFTTT